MSFGPVSRMELQELTYWAPGTVASDGVPVSSPGVLIYGRWIEKRTELQNASGEQFVSQTMAIVDMDLEEGGYLAQGNYVAQDLSTVDDAREIRGFSSTPDLRYVERLRRAYL